MSPTSSQRPVRGQRAKGVPYLPSRTAVALLSLLLCAPLAATAQDPELYQSARAELAAGDTSAALEQLREFTDASPDFAPGWGLLGSVLTELASGVETDFRERLEADKALRRALKLDPRNPAYLMALGSLMRKQQMYVDARRVLNRATDAVEKYPEKITPAETAQLWYQLGLYYEDVYLDTRDLVYAPNLPVYTPECATLGSFCLNFTRPKTFNEYFKHAGSLAEFGEDDLERTLNAFRRALDADPTHAVAFRRLAVHLVEQGDYGEARRLARRFQHHAPDDPWGHITLGLVYQRTGVDSLAEAEFDQGLALAGADIAGHYRSVSSILRESQAEEYEGANEIGRRQLEEVLWRKSDPLYLTHANEVRIAHLGRVAFADLWFEDPSSGSWGADTERGQVHVRYGPPRQVWQVHRESRRPQLGGRWIFWNYNWELPNFIFEKQLRFRRARHMLGSASKQMEEEAREKLPAAFSTDFDLHGYPVQVARFRGVADTIVEVDFYSEVPGDLLLSRPDTLDLGIFLFSGPDHNELYRRTLRLPVAPSPEAVTYSLPLRTGQYAVSIEARAPAGAAAVARQEVTVTEFRDGVLALSDLVLADAVTPKTQEPADRRDFALKVNRQGEFDAELPVAVYWEVYGLATDDAGFANYQVELSVEDAEGKGVLTRIARAFGFGDDQQIELTYDRVVAFNGERVPEYLSLTLPESEPGVYRLSIRVADRNREETVTAQREFRILGSE